jgi:hypothetical protein
MNHLPRDAPTSLTAIELVENVPSVVGVGDKVEQMQGLGDPA